MAILDGLTDIPAKIGELGRSLAPVTGLAGFLYGVDAKWMGSNAGTSYPFSTQGLNDAVCQIFGQGTGKAIFGQVGAATRTFNLGAVMNKGTYGAIGVWALHELMPNKYTKLLKDVALPPLVGYGLGRIFDDPMSPNVDYTTGQNQNYAGGGFRAPLRGVTPSIQQLQRGGSTSWAPGQHISGWR